MAADGEVRLTTQQIIDKEFDEIDSLFTPADDSTPEIAPGSEPAKADPEKTVVPEGADTGTKPVDVAPVKVETVVPPADDDNSPTWRQRYLSLQGVTNHQGAELRTLREDLGALKDQLKEATKAPVVPPAPVDRELDPEFQTLKTELGEKAASVVYDDRQELKALKAKVEGVDEGLKATKVQTEAVVNQQAQTAGERYLSDLTTAVPDWREINAAQDPKFVNFMFQTVPGTNLTFNDLMLQNHRVGDATKVAEIFNLYKTAVGIAKPNPQGDPSPSERPKAEDFIEPGQSAAGADAVTTTEKRIYSRAEVDEFDRQYMKFQSGSLKNVDGTKIEAMWNDIQDAMSEGRVR